MLTIKEIKDQFLNKKWYNSKNELVLIIDIIEYAKLNYKLVYKIGFDNSTQYLNDISKDNLLSFLDDLSKYKKLTMNSEPEKQSKKDLEDLKDKLFMSLNDLLDDSIDCNKANAICKISQTILNLEKIKSQIIKPINFETNSNQ